MNICYNRDSSLITDNINGDQWKKVDIEIDPTLKFPEEERLEDIINIESRNLFSKLELTFVSISGNLTGVEFNVKPFTDTLYPDEDIFVIKSEFGGWFYPNVDGLRIWKDKIEAKIKKKQDKNKKCIEQGTKPRKLRGDGSSLSSQIAFFIRTNSIDTTTINHSKNIYISVFINGRITVLGTKDITLQDAYKYTQKVCNKLKPLMQTDIKISSLYTTAHKYKFWINYPLKTPLICIQRQLQLEKEYVLEHPEQLPHIHVHSIDYDQEKDPAKLTVTVRTVGIEINYPPTKVKKELNVSITCYQNNKVNISGYSPEKSTTFIYNWLRDVYYKVLVTDVMEKYKDKYDFD